MWNVFQSPRLLFDNKRYEKRGPKNAENCIISKSKSCYCTSDIPAHTVGPCWDNDFCLDSLHLLQQFLHSFSSKTIIITKIIQLIRLVSRTLAHKIFCVNKFTEQISQTLA